jgi:thiamine-phosphate pyrophosphorylase
LDGALPRLMLVTDRTVTGGRDLIDIVAQAVEGGVRFVQVRERDLPRDVLLELVLDLREALPSEVLVVVNGRGDVARETGAGLHLPAAAPLAGQERPEFWGRAVHTAEEAAAAAVEKPHYVVVGTIFPTPSKPQYPGAGLGLVTNVARACGDIPVYAIGGVDASRVPELRAAGAYGVAVRRALLQARRPKDAAKELLRAFGAI